MKKILSKLLLPFLVFNLAFSVGLIVKVAWDDNKANKVNTQLTQELMEANLEIGKAKTTFGDAKKMIKKLQKQLAKEIKSNSEIVDAYGILEAEYKAEKAKKSSAHVVYKDNVLDIPSDTGVAPGLLYQARSKDKLALVEKIEGGYEDLRLKAKCEFSPEEGKLAIPFNFSYKLHIKFSGELVKTHTNSGAINYYMNLFEVDGDGKKLGKLELKSFTVTTIDKRAPEFFLIAPHLDISAMAAVGKGLKPQWGAAVGISLMGYGLTKNDLSWRFLNASIDIGSSLGVGFTPAQYNLGQLIPLISNLWIGPHVGFNIDQDWYLGGVIGAQL